jgi:HlyD family secretion protein
MDGANEEGRGRERIGPAEAPGPRDEEAPIARLFSWLSAVQTPPESEDIAPSATLLPLPRPAPAPQFQPEPQPRAVTAAPGPAPEATALHPRLGSFWRPSPAFPENQPEPAPAAWHMSVGWQIPPPRPAPRPAPRAPAPASPPPAAQALPEPEVPFPPEQPPPMPTLAPPTEPAHDGAVGPSPDMPLAGSQEKAAPRRRWPRLTGFGKLVLAGAAVLVIVGIPVYWFSRPASLVGIINAPLVTVYAPVDGQIAKISATEGATLTQGAEIAAIAAAGGPHAVTTDRPSIVWSLRVAQGAQVLRGLPLAELVDCSRLYIEIAHPPKSGDALHAVRAVQVRMSANRPAIAGRVRAVAETPASVASVAGGPSPGTIIVDVDASALQRAAGSSCPVGHGVTVSPG